MAFILRWAIEEAAQSKGKVGLDEYEIRSWAAGDGRPRAALA